MKGRKVKGEGSKGRKIDIIEMGFRRNIPAVHSYRCYMYGTVMITSSRCIHHINYRWKINFTFNQLTLVGKEHIAIDIHSGGDRWKFKAISFVLCTFVCLMYTIPLAFILHTIDFQKTSTIPKKHLEKNMNILLYY